MFLFANSVGATVIDGKQEEAGRQICSSEQHDTGNGTVIQYTLALWEY